ncbi:MAG: choice-of-anchor J domain-containing protein [Bacteroidales bacterium]
MKTKLTVLGLSVLFYSSAVWAQGVPQKESSGQKQKFTSAKEWKNVEPKDVNSTLKTYELDKNSLKNYKSETANSVFKQAKTIGNSIAYKPHYSLQFIGRTKAATADKACVYLQADSIWQDGSGYQMLIDANATAYGTLFQYAQQFPLAGTEAEVYAACEFKIPANADPNLQTANVVVGRMDSVSIPGGTYDLCILNPTAGDRIYIASGKMACLDDFVFEAGYNYLFHVVADGGYDKVLYISPVDAAISGLILPANSPNLSNAELLKVSLSNFGNTGAISNFSVAYSINGGTPNVETYTGSIAMGATVDYVFAKKADFSASGFYTVKAWVNLSKDGNPFNDTVIGKCKHNGILSVPFVESFNTKETLEQAWTIIDANKDKKTWAFNRASDATGEEGGMGEGGSMRCRFNSDMASDDYLVTMDPIAIKAGKAYINFYLAVQGSKEESMDLLYGTSSDVSKMSVLEAFPKMKDMEWCFHNTSFQSEGGNYYFAFHAKSQADQVGVKVDEIRVDTGIFVGIPDLVLKEVVLPVAACDLSATATIQAVVKNSGSEAIRGFQLSYQIDDKAVVSEKFTDTIEVGNIKTITFATTADFSAQATYKAKVYGTCIGDVVAKNDTMEAQTINFVPATVPYVSDFSAMEWNPMQREAWLYEESENAYFIGEDSIPLVSRCITLPVNTYRFSYEYMAGAELLGLVFTDNFNVVYGKKGTDPTTWKILSVLTEENTKQVWVNEEISFDITENGEYVFAFISTGSVSLVIKNIRINQIPDHDVRMNDFYPALSRLTPYEQVKENIAFAAQVENRGKNIEAGTKVVIKKGSDTIGASTPIDLAVGAIKEINLFGKTTLNISDTVNLTAEVSMTAKDENMDDNSMNYSFIVSDTVYAEDDVSDFTPEAGIGAPVPLSLGLLYRLNQMDTLTSLSVALCEVPEDFIIGLAVYQMNENGKLGHCVYSGTYKRGLGGDFKTFSIPSRVLQSGLYFVEVQQIDNHFLNIGVDYNMDGFALTPSEDGQELDITTEFGYPGIRMNFGYNAKVYQKDAMTVSINKPNSTALFAANEPVEATVLNNGAATISNMVVNCMVDKTILTKTVPTLAPYASVEVNFEADLSVAGPHNLTIFTALENDEDPSNDTLTMEIVSKTPADPYVMNFEECEDFDINGFNPAWKTIDKDGNTTGGFQNVSFPHNGEPLGFIVFNPDQTTPSLRQSPDSIAAHGGERFGASVYANTPPNNDWLISPKLKLGNTSYVEFYVKSFDAQYPESYNVLVSKTDGSIKSFTKLKSNVAPSTDWAKINIDLSAYDNQDVFVAIQCVSADAFIFMIDDISIHTNVANENSTAWASQISLYPNPAKEMIAISALEMNIDQVEIYNLLGEKVYQSAKTMKVGQYRINIENFKKGIYFAKVSTAYGSTVLKFVVQ